jgi:hypothetical protein
MPVTTCAVRIYINKNIIKNIPSNYKDNNSRIIIAG